MLSDAVKDGRSAVTQGKVRRNARDDVGSSHLGDGDLAQVGSVEINVIRSNSGSDANLRASTSLATRDREESQRRSGGELTLRFLALARTSAVRYPGWKGVVMSTAKTARVS